MKKLYLIIVLAFAGVSASAQQWQYSFGVSYGAYDRAGLGRYSEIIDVQRSTSVNNSHYVSRPTVLPTFSLETGYVMKDVPIGFFLGAFWNYAWNNLNGGPSLLSEKEHILHILPEVRFYYYKGQDILLYSTMAGGLRYRRYSETFEGDTITNSSCEFSYQFSPFGLSYGEKWTFHCDIGYGTAWAILKLGFGYTF